jgi:threonine aldolase
MYIISSGCLGPAPSHCYRWACQANEFFLIMPGQLVDTLQAAGAEFYQWPVTALPAGITLRENDAFVRLVTSFVTSDEHIAEFCNLIRSYVPSTNE